MTVCKSSIVRRFEAYLGHQVEVLFLLEWFTNNLNVQKDAHA